jgi:hypothetical protein
MPLSRIKSASITDGSVATADLANGAVSNTKLATGSVENYFGTQGFALGMRNRIINGDMRIDQRNAGAAVTNANGYIVDRFISNYFGGGTGRWTAQQVADAPSGFTNSFKVTVTTTDASPSANFAYAFARQPIEGNNVADLAWGTASASTISVSFWVKSSVTGSFPCVVYNGDVSRGYGILYTVNSANTWEYKTFTVPGDTSGTWGTGNLAGINISFGAGGSSRAIASNTWSNLGGTTPTTVTGAVSVIGTLNATWQITGVQLEAGSVATPFERRPYGTELHLCLRYTYKVLEAFYLLKMRESNRARINYYQHPVQMRASPTVGSMTTTDGLAVTIMNITDKGFVAECLATLDIQGAQINTQALVSAEI